MKQDIIYMNPEYFDISIEEFDALSGVHQFSAEYQKNKKSMLKKFRRGTLVSPGRYYAKVAAAAAFLIICTPIAVSAATGSIDFGRIWGNTAKDSIASHEEVIDDDVKEPYTITYPQRDYVDIDSRTAENLVGGNVSYEPVVKEFGDTKLTVLSSVTDGNSALVEFTLEREGGVTALDYGQLRNEGKGACISDDADFYFGIKDSGGFIWVDLDKSTEDKLYCYYYIAMLHSTEELTLETEEYPCTRAEFNASTGKEYEKYRSETKKENIPIPTKPALEKTAYITADGGRLDLSSLSLKIDMSAGLGLSDYEIGLPEFVYYISVNYKDGSNYVVIDTNLDNTSYLCGEQENGTLTCVFNRLVDTDNVESITVNGTIYTAK